MMPIFLVAVLSLSLLKVNAQNSNNSITSTTGSKARLGPFFSGEQIFEENFDKFDSALWQHEVQFSPVNLFNTYFQNILTIEHCTIITFQRRMANFRFTCKQQFAIIQSFRTYVKENFKFQQ